jgi:hypothetical protein
MSVCVSRLRPDELIATLWVRILTRSEGGYAEDGRGALLKLPLHVRFPERGGHYTGTEHSFYDLPGPVQDRGYSYRADQPYNNVWPWEDITDLEIRQYIHDLYLPYWEDEALGR